MESQSLFALYNRKCTGHLVMQIQTSFTCAVHNILFGVGEGSPTWYPQSEPICKQKQDMVLLSLSTQEICEWVY